MASTLPLEKMSVQEKLRALGMSRAGNQQGSREHQVVFFYKSRE